MTHLNLVLMDMARMGPNPHEPFADLTSAPNTGGSHSNSSLTIFTYGCSVRCLTTELPVLFCEWDSALAGRVLCTNGSQTRWDQVLLLFGRGPPCTASYELSKYEYNDVIILKWHWVKVTTELRKLMLWICLKSELYCLTYI